MSGIYIHIPFCKKACHYCDFHFSTSTHYQTEMMAAIGQELVLRKAYLGTELVETIYFGGGTPSLVKTDAITKIIDLVAQHYSLSAEAEITFEANPDDLNVQKTQELKQSPINRLSIGVQSFFSEDLAWMNRSHTGPEAESAIKRVQDAGFENITADLIYGYPLLSNEKWAHNIRQINELQIPHLSSYCLTVEDGTALHHFVKNKKQSPMNEAQSAQQFILLMEAAEQYGFQQYEISNFAKPNQESKHNSNYWKGKNYLGLGPSAHSFNQVSRQWNVANNAAYLRALEQNEIPSTLEQLSTQNRFNEYLMTSLRTSWGIDLQKVHADFGQAYSQHLHQALNEVENAQWLLQTEHSVHLSKTGKLFADRIAASLFIDSHEN